MSVRCTFVILGVAVLAMLLVQRCEGGSLLCKPCVGNECNMEPAGNCEHGVVRDYCGWKVCAKGPGEHCGGPSDLLGKCGEGMICTCGKCSGCSLATMDCFFSSDQLHCIN